MACLAWLYVASWAAFTTIALMNVMIEFGKNYVSRKYEIEKSKNYVPIKIAEFLSRMCRISLFCYNVTKCRNNVKYEDVDVK